VLARAAPQKIKRRIMSDAKHGFVRAIGVAAVLCWRPSQEWGSGAIWLSRK
jgi:hypothetical protein